MSDGTDQPPPDPPIATPPIYVEEGWWHPNVKSGQVHDHTDRTPMTMHRLCEPVFTRRTPPVSDDAAGPPEGIVWLSPPPAEPRKLLMAVEAADVARVLYADGMERADAELRLRKLVHDTLAALGVFDITEVPDNFTIDPGRWPPTTA